MDPYKDSRSLKRAAIFMGIVDLKGQFLMGTAGNSYGYLMGTIPLAVYGGERR